MTQLKPLTESLSDLMVKAQGKSLKFKDLVETLVGRGFPVFLLILTLPFCLPMSIPGLSTPFGLLIMFMGLRFALGKHLYWPQWVLNKVIPYTTLVKMVKIMKKGLELGKLFVKPRFLTLTQNRFAHIFHGLFIVLLGLILALPLPIPLTNFTCSIPLLFLGLGLLEDDGLFVAISYFLGSLSFIFWTWLIIFGHKSLSYYF